MRTNSFRRFLRGSSAGPEWLRQARRGTFRGCACFALAFVVCSASLAANKIGFSASDQTTLNDLLQLILSRGSFSGGEGSPTLFGSDQDPGQFLSDPWLLPNGPGNPGSGAPSNPESDVPSNPGSDIPSNPGSDIPSNPGSDVPIGGLLATPEPLSLVLSSIGLLAVAVTLRRRARSQSSGQKALPLADTANSNVKDV
jgi:hypothetical protein